MMGLSLVAVAQKNTPKAAAPPTRPATAASAEQAGMPAALKGSPDAKIAKLLTQVSPARVQATIEKLVSFGTLITIGPADADTVGKGRGIGAAREWIRSELQRYSDACGLPGSKDRRLHRTAGRAYSRSYRIGERLRRHEGH